jgi:hypothetical protein
MPMYYFNLNDDETVVDTDGTDLPDVGAARIHATGVARELTSNGGGILTQSWSGWTMSVQDAHGTELFSLTMTDFGDGDPEKINPDRSVPSIDAAPKARSPQAPDCPQFTRLLRTYRVVLNRGRRRLWLLPER